MVEYRLSELKSWLLKCRYPEGIVNKGIHNARLQGPACKKTAKSDIITLIHPQMGNFNFQNIAKPSSILLRNAKSEKIKNIFKDIKNVEGIRQPKNILRLITSTNSNNKDTQNVIEEPGIYAECTDPRCQICSQKYIKECSSFTTANDKIWEIRSHINCNSRNVIYYLKCNMCKQVSKTGKTDTSLRTRMNNHISSCRTGRTTDVFDLHVHECGIKNKYLNPPFFEIRAFMKLAKPDKLLTYEKEFHRRK